eukprot:NODE_1242_length_1505_cov_246.934066_g1034_i0.p2 GENE.NODE_1242_length_1505_cov_246.934066_g1034_i0~~NODE_1242_length_1505_cov_246.934066_g1034_i0.p2  ORF type:complete len:325 (-),score=95.94 NODE_1242_length_1505_cov_246.934066_g1034_i0:390-1364(-)
MVSTAATTLLLCAASTLAQTYYNYGNTGNTGYGNTGYGNTGYGNGYYGNYGTSTYGTGYTSYGGTNGYNGYGTGYYGGYPTGTYSGTYNYGPSVNVVSSSQVTTTTTTATTYRPYISGYVAVPEWRVYAYGYWAGSTVLRLRFLGNATKNANGTVVEVDVEESVEALTNRFVTTLRGDLERIQNGTFQNTPEKRFVLDFAPVGSFVDPNATDGLPRPMPVPQEDGFGLAKILLVCLVVLAIVVLTIFATVSAVFWWQRRAAAAAPGTGPVEYTPYARVPQDAYPYGGVPADLAEMTVHTTSCSPSPSPLYAAPALGAGAVTKSL